MDASDESALFEAVYHAAEIGTCITDEHRRFVKVNRASCQFQRDQ
jgi:hypothetical protein